MSKKNILITGCSSGIGYDTAHYLQNNGYKVYATARDAKDVESLKKEGLEAYKLDVTSSSEITKMLSIILSNDAKIDAVFNNAGYGQPGAIEDITTEVLKEQFETNFFGLHELTRQTLSIMRKQGYGRIIQHSSVLGLIALRFRGAYNASKYAIEGLCDTLRLELINTNIYISTINTGPVNSDFRKNAIKMFKKNINYKDSFWKKEYEMQLLSTQSKEDDIFTKESIVVIQNVVDALESKVPKPRYYNTLATYILAYLKRVLSTRTLDKILLKI